MATTILRPDGDGDKAEWTEVPGGAGWSTLDDAITYPATGGTTDRVETSTANLIERLTFPTFIPDRPVKTVTAWSYVKPAGVTVRTDLKTGSTVLRQGPTVRSTEAGMQFGVNEAAEEYWANGGHVAGAPYVAQMGGSIVRFPVFWFYHQFSEGGAYDWTTYGNPKAAYDAALAAGLDVMINVCAAPDFAGSPSSYPPSGLRVPDSSHYDDLADFFIALHNLMPQAKLQVWNEPNYSLFGNGMTAAQAAAMTNTVVDALQSSGAQIIAPATSPGGEQEASAYFNTMWDAISAAGNTAYCDASCHVYPGPTGWQQDITNWLTRLNQRTPNRGWITECGIHQQNHGGAANQNARSRTMYEMARDADIQGIIYHRFRTGTDPVFEAPGDFGVVNAALSGQNYVPNDLFTALQAERAEDPNVGGGAATYRWVSTVYNGTLSQAQVDDLRVDLVSGAGDGGAAAEVAIVYLQVDTESATPGTPVKPTIVVSPVNTTSITESHRMVVRVDVLRNGAKIAEVTPVIGGSVTYDSRAASRARLDLQIADDGERTWTPDSSSDLLAPFGNELAVYRGIETGSQVQLRQLGVFGIDRVDTEDSGQGVTVSVSGLDRSWRFIDAPFEHPQPFAAGTQASDAILWVLYEAWGGLQTSFQSTYAPLPLIAAEEGEDRWAFAQGLARAIGGELYFNDVGVLVLRPIASPSGPAVIDYSEGDLGLLLGVNRSWDRTLTYNKVIVTGESTTLDGPVPRATATDSGASSPTRYGGPFGKKPYFWANRYLTTNAQAQTTATNLLARVVGRPDMLSFSTIVDPNRRPGDIVTVSRESSVAPSAEKHILDAVTIPLDAESPMSCETRVAQILEVSG